MRRQLTLENRRRTMLSDELQRQYARDGFVVLREHLSAAQCTELGSWADALRALPERTGGVRRYNDDEASARGERILSRIERMRPFHAELAALLEGPLLRGLAGRLLGEPALLFKDKLNYKLPGTGKFDLHQDMQAGWRKYAPRLTTVLVAIDACTEQNGYLEVWQGAHDRGLLGPEWSPLTAADVADYRRVPCPLQAGDVVAFDAYVPHCSASNSSAAPRRVLLATYNGQSSGDCYERYFADKLASYPPDVERDPAREYRYRV